jgi:uncharacterized protein (TIGR03435 family)
VLPIQAGKALPALCGMGRLTGQEWDAFAVTMSDMARLLSDHADRKVVDRTGLSGVYDVHLNLSPEDFGLSSDPAGDPGAAVSTADVFARMRASMRGFGLSLRPANAEENFLIIDAAERPSGN